MIGVFDSGFGGLSILKEIRKALPEYDYLYLGDSARAPYGTRSREEVHAYTLEAVEYLMRERCELIIIACNTASAEAVGRIQQEYLPQHYPDRRVLGVIVPAAEAAVAATSNKRIGVLATQGTVSSGTVVNEIRKLNPAIEVFQEPAPLLVSFTEAGEHHTGAAATALEGYIAPLLTQHIDTLVLACTHYEHMEAEVRSIVGPDIHIVSEGKVVGEKLAAYLVRHPELAARLSSSGTATFFTTGDVERFKLLGGRFLGESIEAHSISLS